MTPAIRFLRHLDVRHMAAFTVLRFLYGREDRAADAVMGAYFDPRNEGWP